MNIEVYYFSGTGNSLHAAKELQKRIPEIKLIPIVSLLNRDIIETHGEIVGLVFPIHIATVPVPVRKFLEKLDSKSAEYTFGLATRLGTFCVANIYIQRMLQKQGKNLDSFLMLNMANNSPTGIKPGPGDQGWINQITPEKVMELESVVQNKLDFISKIIRNKEKYPPKNVANLLSIFLERLISSLSKDIKAKLNFYTDTTCTGCGICVQVCPSRKIKMAGGKPVWQEELKCYYCYACFNYCPGQSVLLKKYTAKNGRYSHPEITEDDIAGQK